MVNILRGIRDDMMMNDLRSADLDAAPDVRELLRECRKALSSLFTMLHDANDVKGILETEELMSAVDAALLAQPAAAVPQHHLSEQEQKLLKRALLRSASEVAPAAAGVSEEPAAWFYDHPDALHGDRHVRWQNARPTGLNALVWKPLYRHSLSERAGWRWLKDSTFDERSFHEDAPLENGIYHNDCVNCGRTFVGYKRRTICKVCSSLAARSKE